jgi:hypothetical protein
MATPDLLSLYIGEHGTATPFAANFLHPTNLVHIQEMLNMLIERAVPGARSVQWNLAMQWSLIAFTHTYEGLDATTENILGCAAKFAVAQVPTATALYDERNFWNRWRTQCVPDPRNMGYAVDTRADRSVDMTDYLLTNHPAGYKYLPDC